MTQTLAMEEREQIKNQLLAFLEPTYTVYTVMKHVSSSGMTRHISCYVATKDDRGTPQITEITWYVSKILEMRRNNKNGGLVVSGCGMDMGFHVVYELSCALFCPKKYEHDSAYKLTQRWL